MSIETDLRIIKHRGHKFPPSLTLLSFKTRIKWPPVLTNRKFSRVFFQLHLSNIQGNIFSAHKAGLMTKTDLIFSALSLTFADFAVHFSFHCKISFHKIPFKSNLTVAWFFWTNHNSLLCIGTNEIASFC